MAWHMPPESAPHARTWMVFPCEGPTLGSGDAERAAPRLAEARLSRPSIARARERLVENLRLLVGAGLTLRSFAALSRVNPGFDPKDEIGRAHV